MEFITPLIILAIVAFLTAYLRRQGVTALPQMPARKTVEPAQDWDEEYLRTEAAKHSLVRIEDCEVVFTSSNPGKPRPGFRWVCTCGKTKGVTRALKVAEFSYNSHQREMREAALAQLGRFK